MRNNHKYMHSFAPKRNSEPEWISLARLSLYFIASIHLDYRRLHVAGISSIILHDAYTGHYGDVKVVSVLCVATKEVGCASLVGGLDWILSKRVEIVLMDFALSYFF